MARPQVSASGSPRWIAALPPRGRRARAGGSE